MIRQMGKNDIDAVVALWNEAVEAKEVVYYPLTPEYFHKKFELDPNYDPRFSLVDEEDGNIVGFINGIAKKVFLNNETNENTPGFLTCVFVKKEWCRKGIGKALVQALEDAFRSIGKKQISCDGSNPVNLDWIIPGTPGHDHNNAPGMDEDCAGFPFLKALGFADADREIAMYLDLKEYQPWPEFDERRKALAARGIEIGRYDTDLDYDYDGMCDRVGSEYWRSVLKSEIACHKRGVPNTDIRFIPNGKVPAGPRPILVAVSHPDRAIVAQTGPIDKQDSGRGWFTGICTDPLFERQGIASVLFNLLMQEFIAEGAKFSTIFTGDTNHAQKIYKRCGFRVVRRFTVMQKAL